MKRLFEKRFSMAETVGLLVMTVVGLTAVSYAVVSIPNVFTPGTTVKASEVNANFSTLANAINAIPAGPQGPAGLTGATGATGPAGPGTRTVRSGTCPGTNDIYISAPEVTLSSPPLVQAWVASDSSISVRLQPFAAFTTNSVPVIGEGTVILPYCPSGWFYSVVTVK